MMFRRREFRPVVERLVLVAPEPVLARLEGPDDVVPGLRGVLRPDWLLNARIAVKDKA